MNIERPYPSEAVLESFGRMTPDPELREWIYTNYIEDTGPLYSDDHDHLQHASIGVLWSTEPNTRQGRAIIGQAEIPAKSTMGGKWLRARVMQQLADWFGEIPDFLITLDANYCAVCPNVDFLALVDHELTHCAQDRDAFGMPKFNKQTGMPTFTMRGHDVEEFVSVVRRFGVGAAGAEAKALVEAAQSKPEIGAANIAKACGTCLKAAA